MNNQKYKVILPIEVDGKIYQHGAVVELPIETAKLYSHALTAVAEPEKEHNANGGNS